MKNAIVMLLVEDNPADIVFFEEALEATQTPVALHVVGHGVDAMLFLRRQGPYAASPRPDVIVLDLNLPVKHGREVLLEIAADAALKTLPVAILTTSTSEEHLCEIYPCGRCRYFTKTADFRELQQIIREIEALARAA